MTAIVRVLSGARAGHVLTCDGSSAIRVGREAGLELQLDPLEDRDVSSLHATIATENDRWTITDMGSRNGTYVNGRKIVSPTAVADGDKVAFGAHGPEIEIRLFDAERTLPFPPPASAQSVAEPATRSSAPFAFMRDIRRDVRRATRTWRWTSIKLTIAACGVLAQTLFSCNEQRERERERTLLLARVETALGSREANADAAGLAAALRESREAVREGAEKLGSAERIGKAAQRRELASSLQSALTTLGQQQAAASIDREGIRRRNERAVAKVFVEYESGEVASGTGFAVRADGTLLTSSHVVSSSNGAAPRRVAVQFANSDQVWTARILATDPDDDLAVIKVDGILGSVPVVERVNVRPDTIVVGAPVLMIGFPLGGTLTPSDRVNRSVVAPVADAGSVTSVTQSAFEVRGYGAPGSSGSPIFDSRGEVVAIAFGGRSVVGVHHTVATWSAAAVRLLARHPSESSAR